MLDVAAVAEVLLEHESETTRLWASRSFGFPPQFVSRWIASLIGLHDFGKAIPGFQNKWRQGRESDEASGLEFSPNSLTVTDHGCASAALLHEHLISLQFTPAWIRGVLQAISAHHGYNFLIREISRSKPSFEDGNWSPARQALFEAYWAVLQPTGMPSCEELSLSAVEWLAGLTSVADWIGSNIEWFQPGERVDNLQEYFEHSKTLARTALNLIGWPAYHSLLTAHATTNHLIDRIVHADGSRPRPLQVEGDRLLVRAQGPTLLLVEAPMGEGKTELAFLAHLRLQAANRHRGMYFALPTKATGNAMFERTLDFLRAFSPEIKLDIQLVHSGSLLDERVQHLRGIYGERGDNISSSAWFSQRRRPLISPYGVGTIDQALFATLNVKHHFVRLWGLANRVVVLDEVHAYDTYTSGLIVSLLRWLKAVGCSVILMSATLPVQRRNELLRAWNVPIDTIPELAYPRLMMVDDKGLQTTTFDSRPLPSISLIAINEEVDSLAACARDCLAHGGHGAVIVNTVDRAQKIYSQLRERLNDDTQLILFHARFPADERSEHEQIVARLFGNTGKTSQRPGKALLIATQVAEQSLDVDFDFLITDLAPVDLILQRAGRLHRHQRIRPDAHQDARLYVAGLEPDRLPDLKKTGWEYVYDSYILSRTWALLSREKLLKLPADIDRLVQAVYSDGPLPEDLPVKAKESIEGSKWGKHLANLQTERQQAINAAIDPCAEPQSAYIEKPRANEEGEGWGLSSRTRLGDESVSLVPVHVVPGGWSLFSGGDSFDPDSLLEDGLAKAVFARQFSSSRKDVVQHFAKVDAPASFSEHPLLRHLKPLVLDGGVAQIGSLTLRLDSALGIVYEKAVALHPKDKK
jgi:CRISPR-associated endonuclease/helicase Cas3